MFDYKTRGKENLTVIVFISIILSILLSGSFVSASNHQYPSTFLPETLQIDVGKYDFELLQDLDDSVEMESLILSIILGQYDAYNLVGVTYSVVKNGSVLLTGGYGASNFYYLTPVDPITTLFRVGSISKTFIAISILQLMEDGLIALDTDVNNYLTAFQIVDTYEEPITIRHLLTHTAGFEETVSQSVFESALEMPDLEETLTTDAPQRVNPPGEVVSYSNYGFTLLGYIIQELTALPFEQYVQMEILDPFGMNHTSFEQPLPVPLVSDMATGYDEGRVEGYYEYLSISPAAALTSSAGDMAKFMIAMLNNASYNGNQILENSTVELMQSEQFTTHPDLPGMCFGLYEMNTNGEYIIGHGGDTIFFHSRMMLFPEHDLGVFITYNNREGGIAKYDFSTQFIDHYFPYHIDEIVPMDNYDKKLDQFTGFYLSSRRHYSSASGIPKDLWMRIAGLEIYSTGQYLKFVGASIEFVQIAPNYFVERTGDYDFTIIFFKDDKGRITHFHSDIVGPTSTYEKLNFIYRNIDIFNSVIIAFAVIFLISLAYWGAKGLNNFLTKSESIRSLDTIIKWWTLGIPVTFIPYAYYIDVRTETIIFLEKEVPAIFGSTYILLLFTLVFTAGLVIFSVISWTSFRPSSIKARKELQIEENDIGEETEEQIVEEVVEEIDENIPEEPIEVSKFSEIVQKILTVIRTFQPLFKRLHYSLLAILSIALVSLFASWNLLDLF
ncbi:MAG: serine hydrolase [Candidatus Heimdallarchaeota archaeon]|nr:serine hydrolase [Candidatus Heimdallarchaeota archaeon]